MINVENDLIIIDCIEKIRSHLLACDPNLEKILYNMHNQDFGWESAELIWQSFLAVTLNININSAAGRRKIHQIIMEIHSKDLEPGTATTTKPKPGFSLLTNEEIAKIGKHIQVVVNMFASLKSVKKREINWLKLINDLSRSKTGLNGIKAYRFLSLLGAPVAVLDSRKRNFLFRIGWLNALKTNQRSFELYQNLCAHISQLCNESVQSLDYLMGLFAGSEKSTTRDMQICGENTLCSKCPLVNYCHYYHLFKAEAIEENTQALKIARLPAELPREKLLRLGASALSDSELVAIMLRTGTKSLSAVDLSNVLLNKLGTLRALEAATINELCSIKGIGQVKAAEIKAVIELGKRFSQEKRQTLDEIKESNDIYDHYKLRFTNYKQEVFLMLIVNSRNQITREVEVSKGSLTSCTVHPREAFKEAIRDSGSGVIFVHNHPSGDPAPSRADIMLTERLKKAGDILGIRVLDHVIIGDERYYSFTDEGLLL